ncbi:MAG: hypothetical protein L0226_05860 [Acidobacteria bacterium]|nr:hypothetical protein [Acidobacteriota bacterium]
MRRYAVEGDGVGRGVSAEACAEDLHTITFGAAPGSEAQDRDHVGRNTPDFGDVACRVVRIDGGFTYRRDHGAQSSVIVVDIARRDALLGDGRP